MANPAGRFIWVDLAHPDPDAAAKFYRTVFGWESEQVSPDPSAPYWYFRKDGLVAAGMGRLSAQQQEQGVPAMWTSYVKVDDCAAAAAAAADMGGTVAFGPMQIFTSGTMAVVVDPTGAAVAIWESADFDGAEAFNSPGFFSWNELATRDPETAAAFYSALFGWSAEVGDSPIGPYTMWKVGDRMNGGMYDASTILPDHVPSYWGVYFTVEDLDAALAALGDAGGSVLNGPFAMGEASRMAAVADDAGAHFLLYEGPTD